MIIPNFGGFLSDYKSAIINPITHEFSPPESEISFNSSLQKDDGLLKSEISRGEGIEIQQAETLIEAFVNELKNRLEEHTSYKIDGLGTFDLKDEKTVYTPEKVENLNPDTFGLPNFAIHPIERNTEDMKRVRPVPPARRVVKRKPTEVVSDTKKVAVEVKESSSAAVKEVSKKVEEDKEVGNKRPLYVILPVLFLLIAGGVTGYIFYKKNNTSSSTLASKQGTESASVKTNTAGLVSGSSATADEELDKAITGNDETTGTSSETLSSSVADKTDDENTNTVSSSSELSDASTESNSSGAQTDNVSSSSENKNSASSTNNNSGSSSVSSIGTGYNIVIGSFSVTSNAKKVMDKTAGSGIVNYNGLNCVSVGTYSTREEAMNALSGLISEHPGAWVANIR